MNKTEEQRMLEQAERLFGEICFRFYVGFFDEDKLHRILSNAIYQLHSNFKTKNEENPELE